MFKIWDNWQFNTRSLHVNLGCLGILDIMYIWTVWDWLYSELADIYSFQFEIQCWQ